MSSLVEDAGKHGSAETRPLARVATAPTPVLQHPPHTEKHAQQSASSPQSDSHHVTQTCAPISHCGSMQSARQAPRGPPQPVHGTQSGTCSWGVHVHRPAPPAVAHSPCPQDIPPPPTNQPHHCRDSTHKDLHSYGHKSGNLVIQTHACTCVCAHTHMLTSSLAATSAWMLVAGACVSIPT